MPNLPENLKILRKLRNLNQSEVADKIGVQYYTLGKWEQGRAEPSTEDLSKLADFFEVSIDYLVGREDDFGNVVVSGQTSDQLTQKEKRLLQAFGKLPELEQNKLISDAEFYALRHVKQDQH